MPRRAKHYWLFKSEPNVFSIEDLAEAEDGTTCWEGVRNYQARNMLRDDIREGDEVLFYHSRVDPMAVVGVAVVVRGGYPDHFAFQDGHKYFDPKSSHENPSWFMVDIKLQEQFSHPVTRPMLADNEITADMMVMRKGSRLSIQPVTADEFRAVRKMGRAR